VQLRAALLKRLSTLEVLSLSFSISRPVFQQASETPDAVRYKVSATWMMFRGKS